MITRAQEDLILRTISSLEKGEVKPTTEKILGLAKIYGLDLDRKEFEETMHTLIEGGFAKGFTTTGEEVEVK